MYQCIVSLIAEFLTLKNLVIAEINTITEKLKSSTHSNNEHTPCQEQISYLRFSRSNQNSIKRIKKRWQNPLKRKRYHKIQTVFQIQILIIM